MNLFSCALRSWHKQYGVFFWRHRDCQFNQIKPNRNVTRDKIYMPPGSCWAWIPYLIRTLSIRKGCSIWSVVLIHFPSFVSETIEDQRTSPTALQKAHNFVNWKRESPDQSYEFTLSGLRLREPSSTRTSFVFLLLETKEDACWSIEQ